MTPLDAETQRLLAIYDAWLACRCGEQERWAEDVAGRCKHERALHYVAEEACEHIRYLSERLARVEAETREACAAMVEEYFIDERCGICHLGMGDIRMTAGMQEELAAAIRAGK